MTTEEQDALSPDRFIRELWATAPEYWWVEFFLIQYRPTEKDPDAKAVSAVFYTVDQVRKDWPSIWRYLQSANRTEVRNVHPAVNPRFKRPKKRGKNSDVSHYMAAWVDVDFHLNEESVKKAFWAAVEDFVKAGLPPSIIVESGHGLHAYWLYDKPYPSKEARKICAGIQDAFKVSDSISDPSRVLRMPGTVNLKDAKHPATCQVIQATYVRYPLAAFADYAVEPTKSAQEADDEAVERKNQEIIKRLGKSSNKEIEEIKKGVPESGGIFGGRNQAATKYTGWLFSQGLSADKVRELILEWNKLNSPPLPDEEIATVIGSIAKAEAENHPAGRKSGSDNDERSDILAALQLRLKYGDQLMYCGPMKNWLIWDGARWTEDRKNIAFGKSTDIAAAAGIKRHRADRIAATLRVAQPMLAVVPEDLNKDPWVLNCKNGTLNLKDMSWKKHDQKDMLTYLCPTAYEPEAQAPLWEKFLLEIMGGSTELVSYLQRLAGYCLTGVIRDHALPIAYGVGGNGKSTFLGVLREIMGNDYSTEAAPDLLMTKDKSAHPTERADLSGKRLVTTIEVEDGKRLAENFVKQLTGGDDIKVRRMHENFWTLKPTWKIILATNNKPEIKGMDAGVWRRIRLIPFSVTIPAGSRDLALREKLVQAEASGILAWAVRGCRAWKGDGLQDPAAVLEATAEYKQDADVMGRFFSDCCLILPSLRAQASQLYDVFREWHEKEVGTEPMNGTVFGRRLTELGFKVEKTSGKKWRMGIGIGELSFKSSKTNEF